MAAQDSKQHDLNALIEKYDSMKKREKLDLSSDQDLTLAIMNLISIEEHLAFSGAKTGKTEFYDLIESVREMRKELLQTVVKEPEGEVWCISKHLLSASMRLMEVATKAQSMGKRPEAYGYFSRAYDLYALFWGLQMKVVVPSEIGTVPENVSDGVPAVPDDSAVVRGGGKGFMGKLGDLVRKAVDCCIE